MARMSNRVTNHPVCSISHDWIVRAVGFLSLHKGRSGSALGGEILSHIVLRRVRVKIVTTGELTLNLLDAS